MNQTDVVHQKNALLAHVSDVEDRLPGRKVPWLTELRQAALDVFRETGLPTQRDEAWKYTNLDQVRETPWVTAPTEASDAVTAQDLEPSWMAGLEGPRVVIVNGQLVPDLSDLSGLPEGVTATSLADALETDPDALEGVLGKALDIEGNVTAALNTATFQDGLYVHVPRGVHVEQPIQLLVVTASTEKPIVTAPRVLVHAEETAQVTLVQSAVTVGEGQALTVPVTEIVAGAGANVTHHRLGLQGEEAVELSTVAYDQERDANIKSFHVTLGGKLVRNDVSTEFRGEGAHCDMNGLFSLRGEQHCDNHTWIDHQVPHCTSHELFKGIVDDRSRGTFLGRIYVAEDAQRTDAIQHNPNLILSKEALVNSTPQLEIFADDVRCTHGSTLGQLDKQAILYCMARGIPEATARGLMTFAFAGEVLELIDEQPVRDRLTSLVLDRLPNGDLVREALDL